MLDAPVCSSDGLVALMHALARMDEDGEGIWPHVWPDGHLSIHINANDLFYWACADGEHFTEDDIPLLNQCIDDLEKADSEHGINCWSELYCCRRRGMRPQYPFFRKYDREKCRYTEDLLSPPVRALFDALGPDGSDKNRG